MSILKINPKMRRILAVVLFTAGFFVSFFPHAEAATLSFVFPQNPVPVGSAFSVNIILDTKGQVINAADIKIYFPANKLQVVQPSGSNSIFTIWAVPPTADNAQGVIELQGAIPKGITTSDGIIATINFRAENTGNATLSYSSESRILANDGLGTNLYTGGSNASLSIVLPPPQGPVVFSDSHPDQNKWYRENAVSFYWKNNFPVDGYSYVLNDIPVDQPPLQSIGTKASADFSDVPDGTHYFHLRALRNDIWGGLTNFAVNIDTTPPAKFPVTILIPSGNSFDRPVIQFSTTDNASGIDRYTLKIVSAGNQAAIISGQPIFTEAESPYIAPALPLGAYTVIVRAYDRAGNFTEQSVNVSIHNPLVSILPDGSIQIEDWITIPMPVAGGIAALLTLIVLVLSVLAHRRHRAISNFIRNAK